MHTCLQHTAHPSPQRKPPSPTDARMLRAAARQHGAGQPWRHITPAPCKGRHALHRRPMGRRDAPHVAGLASSHPEATDFGVDVDTLDRQGAKIKVWVPGEVICRACWRNAGGHRWAPWPPRRARRQRRRAPPPIRALSAQRGGAQSLRTQPTSQHNQTRRRSSAWAAAAPMRSFAWLGTSRAPSCGWSTRTCRRLRLRRFRLTTSCRLAHSSPGAWAPAASLR